MKKTYKTPAWKSGISFFLASVIFPIVSRIIIWCMGIEASDKVSGFSGGFMAAFILGMAIAYGVIYIFSYYFIHLIEKSIRLVFQNKSELYSKETRNAHR